MREMKDFQTVRQKSRLHPCPCETFSSIEKVLDSIKSSSETESLTLWLRGGGALGGNKETAEASLDNLDGDSAEKNDLQLEQELKLELENVCLDDNGHSYCGERGRCPNRVGAAFTILNAIRDGCREFLEEDSSDVTDTSKGGNVMAGGGFAEVTLNTSSSPFSASSSVVMDGESMMRSKSKSSTYSYEDSFPSLASSSNTVTGAPPTILTARKKEKKNGKLSKEMTIPNTNSASNTFSKENKWKSINNTKSQPDSHEKNTANIGLASKKRIRPAPVRTLTTSPWGKSPLTLTPDAVSKGLGNISSLPSQHSIPAAQRSVNSNMKRKDPMDHAMSTSVTFVGKSIKSSSSSPKSSAWNKNNNNTTINQNKNQNTQNLSIVSSNIEISPPTGQTANDKLQNSTSIASSTVQNNIYITQDEVNNPSKDTHRLEQHEQQQKTLMVYIARLSDVYSTIIQNQLIPSIALELQLLLRLLSLRTISNGTETKDDLLHLNNSISTPFKNSKRSNNKSTIKNTKNEQVKNTLVRQLFQTPKGCQTFAISVLTKIQTLLSNLGKEIITSLVLFPPMNTFLSSVVQRLRSILDTNVDGTVNTSTNISVGGTNEHHFVVVDNPVDHKGLGMLSGGGTSTAILTVPFEEKRDSRHNYRTRDLSSVFNNREECRDAFLFQLRAFQEVRGTVLNPNQIERSLTNIRVASKKMMQMLFDSNVPWFTEFFCELLLQIGLVPMEETDKEILRHVSDKDRLQKLHRRFTSKVGQKNKSSQRLVLNDKNEGSRVVQPDQFFPGHQEFFFLFIQSVDSYRFGVQLQKHLAGLISLLVSSNETKGLEQRITKLQLLAKFLGMLAFSTNWILNGSGQGATGNHNVEICAANYTVPLLPLKRYIEDAWKEKRLITVIPWVVDFLRMSSWDKMSQQLKYYQEVFSLLRVIHKKIGSLVSQKYVCYLSNWQLVSFHLETLFSNVLGLAETERLSLSYNPMTTIDTTGRTSFDLHSLQFSRSFLFSSSSHLDELQKLIADLTRHNGRLLSGSGASKKLKPYAISLSSDNGLSELGHTQDHFASFDSLNSYNFPNSVSPPNQDEYPGVRGKLIDSFFHQHKDLQQLCEFVVDFSVKNVSTILLDQCIVPTVEESIRKYTSSPTKLVDPVDVDYYLKTMRNVEQDALVAALNTMRVNCREYICNSMKALAPPQKSREVVEIATKLAIQYASLKGKEVASSFARAEAKKQLDAHIQGNTKSQTGANNNQEAVSRDVWFELDEFTKLLRDHMKLTVGTAQYYSMPQNSIDLMEEINRNLNRTLLVSENKGRKFGTAAVDASKRFSEVLLPYVSHYFSGDSSMLNTWPSGLTQAIEASSILGKTMELPRSELGRTGILLLQNLDAMMSWHYHEPTKGEFSETDRVRLPIDQQHKNDIWLMLKAMLDGNMINARQLEEKLLEVLQGPTSQKVSRQCLTVLGLLEKDNAMEWMNPANFIMPRLQTKMKR